MNRRYMILALALFVLTLGGCYDNNETDILATVMAVGIEGTHPERTYTFAVADTGGLSDSSRGDGAGVICFGAAAPDVASAIKIVDAKTSKKLSFSHLSAILFSQDAIAEGVFDDTDYFQKKAYVRPQTMLAVTEASPGDYLNKLNLSLEANPERYFESLLKKKNTYVPECSISDFVTAYHTQTQCLVPIVSYADAQGAESAQISASILAGEGMSVAMIEDNWLLGLVLDTREVRRGFDTLQSIKKPAIDVVLKDNIPFVSVSLAVRAEPRVDAAALEDEIETKLTSYARNLCDVVNIATLARGNFRLWKDYSKYEWSSLVKNAVFDVKVTLLEEDNYD